jgi:hypothetical protein
MRIAFIGHPFHQWSKSSEFFIEELSKKNEVHRFFPSISEYEVFLEDFRKIDAELVVVWQVDSVIEILPKGLPMVFVPMLDSLIHANSSYWLRLADKVKFLCFSTTVFRYLRHLGIRSCMEIQYWLPPIDNLDRQTDENLYAYFWERDPNQVSEADAKIIADKFSLELVTRKAPDILERSYSHADTIEKRKHVEKLKNASLFIAPRNFEGIGMSFLEAMSYQVPVAAKNLPSANEYIKNGASGFLYGKGESINLTNLSVVRENLYFENLAGHNSWCEKIPAIIDWLPSELDRRSRISLYSRKPLSRFIL